MYDTYTNIPTIFEIKIRELGWIHHVYLVINGYCFPAEWICSIPGEGNHMYSIFRVTHTFENAIYNQEAVFHYSIEMDKEAICKPIKFNVYPFYDDVYVEKYRTGV